MATRYNEDQIHEKLADYPGWTLGDDGMLHKEFMFKNFAEVMLFANAVGFLAERADHHPDLFIHSYKHLRVDLMTHSADGITDKDFALIDRIEGLPRGT